MAQNITLLDTDYLAVPSVILPKTGGGEAEFTDVTDTTAVAEDVAQGKYFYAADGTRTAGTSTGGGGGDYLWFGEDAELIQTYVAFDGTLAQTRYPSWTPSTTAYAIVAANNSYATLTIDGSHDYVLVYDFWSSTVYDSSATGARVTRDATQAVIDVVKKPLNYDDATHESFITTSGNTVLSTIGWMYYCTSSNIWNYTTHSSYGAAYSASASSPGVTNPATNTPTLTLKMPAINARCSTSYFSTANAAKVDTSASTAHLELKVYRVNYATSAIGKLVHDTLDKLNS